MACVVAATVEPTVPEEELPCEVGIAAEVGATVVDGATVEAGAPDEGAEPVGIICTSICEFGGLVAVSDVLAAFVPPVP